MHMSKYPASCSHDHTFSPFTGTQLSAILSPYRIWFPTPQLQSTRVQSDVKCTAHAWDIDSAAQGREGKIRGMAAATLCCLHSAPWRRGTTM